MLKQTLPKAHEIVTIIYTLEEQLNELDRLGAGIAAIHVNAAIEQLRTNLRIVNDNMADCDRYSPLRLVSVLPQEVAKNSEAVRD